MKHLTPFFSLFVLFLFGCSSNIELQSNDFSFQIGENGSVVGMVDRLSSENLLADGIAAPLLSLRIDDIFVSPVGAEYDGAQNTITLTYPEARKAVVQVQESASHIRFELVELAPLDDIELVVWGPYPTVLNDVIGETVGVVQGEGYAIGLQALNPKTLGGFPWNENDALPQMDIFESGDYSDLSPAGKRGVLYRVEAAKPDSFGSTLQAYTRERSSDRIVPNRGYAEYVAPAYADGGVVGSSIALFGSSASEALSTIGAIEVAEGLPHPMIDGEWGKMAKGASAAYLILGFGERDIDRALDIVQRTGLRYLYHSDPFETWGHFKLRESYFPNGIAGLKSIVDRAHAQNVMVGVHMLSNFITPNDPYVTPVPDQRLARVGTSTLAESINASQSSIPISSPRYFNQQQQSYLRASVISDEIIQCDGVSGSEPWNLVGCERGAFDTRPDNHARGDIIGKLDDHGYNVFLSTTDLSIEMAATVGDLFNQTGLRQISFDGLEGNRSTGMGNYGEILFTKSWFDTLNENVRSHYIADASRTSHFFWHMYTRMNWGEPWYAGFRESQTEYRLKNQAYFKRNLMPGMLGWFSMRPETSVEDIEWMLARSAGFDAGYGFVTGYDQIDQNGQSKDILALLGVWEAARMGDAFSEDQKERMKEISNEFHLEHLGDSSWNLYPVSSLKFSHVVRDRQPGEPDHSTFTFDSSEDVSGVEFIISPVGTDARVVVIQLDGKQEFRIPGVIEGGQHVKFEGGDAAGLYSSTWNKLADFSVPSQAFTVSAGAHSIRFIANADQSTEAEIKFEIRLVGAAELVLAN